MSDNLADRIINQLDREQERSKFSKYTSQWGIDDSGFPWPNPVNSQAVAVWIFSKWGKVNGVDNIYMVDDDIFIGGKKIRQDRPTLLSLYNKPKIILWANENASLQNEDELWVQIKKIISSEWPIVWAIVRDIAPEYNRDYIRISDGLIWGKNEADLITK